MTPTHLPIPPALPRAAAGIREQLVRQLNGLGGLEVRDRGGTQGAITVRLLAENLEAAAHVLASTVGIRLTFDALYRPAVSITRASDDDPAGRSGPVHYEVQVTPVFERYLYRPVIRAVEWLADAIRPVQSGNVNLYLLYVFAVILLAYLLGAV